MTEPSRPRPVPVRPAVPADEPAPVTADSVAERFADLAQRPVGEHVAVFEAEHDRLQRELGTIDEL